mmetsp:Transcript_11115/g.23442  ORF Transcript_11115/g.23442 Transcript_11115/m.23442 type:complete len:528 (+) Transcript_11115:203-1786(+)
MTSRSTNERKATSRTEEASTGKSKVTEEAPDDMSETKAEDTEKSPDGSSTYPNSSMLSLPDDALRSILEHSSPPLEYQRWEWEGIVRQTCKTFQRLTSEQNLLPRVLRLADFAMYESPLRPGSSVDVRAGILTFLLEHKRTAEALTELHVNWLSVSRLLNGEPAYEDGNNELLLSDDEVMSALHSLLTTQSSLPNLDWLDVHIEHTVLQKPDLVDTDVLEKMPAALPSITKLTLGGCFPVMVQLPLPDPAQIRVPMESRSRFRGRYLTTPELEHFFRSIQSQLTSLSLYEIQLSHSHIAAFLPLIGKHLTRLEIFNCEQGIFRPRARVSDATATFIAQHCSNLESFGIAGSDITATGLSAILEANRNISKLNLSRIENRRMNYREIMDVIERWVPRVQSLRHGSIFRFDRERDWVVSPGLISLINSQLRHPDGGGVSLRTLQVSRLFYRVSPRRRELALRSLRYALNNGVQRVEVCPAVHPQRIDRDVFRDGHQDVLRALEAEFPHVSFVELPHPFYVEGSECNGID